MKFDPNAYVLLANEAYARDKVPDIGAAGSSARAIVRQTSDGTAVGMPGTDNLACWLADLDCRRVTTALGGLHYGINSAAISIYAAVRDAHPGILFGHSEGAALALIIAGKLCLDGCAPDAVFAFEPPQICCDDILGGILRQHGVKIIITRNGEDIVPMVPRLEFPWRHPAEMIMMGTRTEPVLNILDHSMIRVIPAVAAAARRIQESLMQ